jgi:tRNA pseudouridine38-40 synthase
VHATGQVVSFTTESSLSPERWVGALNAHLPPTIAVREAWAAPDGFHARFSATSRQYRYTIVNRPARPAIGRQYCWHVPQPLDEGLMDAALVHLRGRRDFASFAGQSPNRGGRHTVRSVLAAACVRRGEEVRFELTADAFLPHMVRNVVGTLARVGRGVLAPDDVDTILAARDRAAAGPTAPAHGLCLIRVNYGVRE